VIRKAKKVEEIKKPFDIIEDLNKRRKGVTREKCQVFEIFFFCIFFFLRILFEYRDTHQHIQQTMVYPHITTHPHKAPLARIGRKKFSIGLVAKLM